MKFIEPFVRVLDNDALSPVEKLESVGRVCYRSEDKITDGSCIDFVKKIIQRGHYSILEHVNFNFRLSGVVPKHILLELGNMQGVFIQQKSNNTYVNMNLRNAVELYRFNHRHEFLKLIVSNDEGLRFCFSDIEPIKKKDGNLSDFVVTNRMRITILPCKKVPKSDETAFYTVFFNIQRGIWDELARHRKNACACESSRYCLYSKDKFDGQITYTKPVWWETEKRWYVKAFWKFNFWLNEKFYLFFAKFLPAQYARGVLPLDYNVKCCVTASLSQWKHILKLRTSAGAHPDMVKTMSTLKNLLNITDDDLKKSN